MFPTLRLLVGVGGALLVVIGALAILSGSAAGVGGLWAIVLGVAGVLIAAFEQVRYGEETAPKQGLRPTDEVFVDPTSGQRMRVWSDPASGAREYRSEE